MPPRNALRAALRCTALEGREVPASLVINQSFDTTAVGALPAGWSANTANFSVQSGPATNGSRSLSTVAADAVGYAVATPVLTGAVELSANIQTLKLNPIQLFARGSALGSGQDNFISITLSGSTFALTRSVGGRYETLATVNTGLAADGRWARLTLSVDGTQVRASVQRLDTGEYFVGGQWQSASGWALQATDKLVPTSGVAGIMRRTLSLSAVRVDDFRLTNGDPDTSAPAVAFATAPPATLSAAVTLTATASDDQALDRVEWLIDSQLVASQVAGPFNYVLNPTTLGDGSHTVSVRAVDTSGNITVASRTVTVSIPDTTPPTVGTPSLSSGSGTASGSVVVTANATDNKGVSRVEFLLDGTLRQTDTAAPWTWTLDTAGLTNGAHALVIKAYDAAGNLGQSGQTITVQNVLAQPPVASASDQHYSHIRVAMLAYSGTPFTATETALLQNSIDLVIPNPQYLSGIDTTAPNTPQLVYTNVSNLYGSLLSDWLAYADRTGGDREAAFYHAASAIPFTGTSPASQPVTWFWNVRSDSADLTYNARSSVADALFGSVGQSVNVGSLDKFREINLDFGSGASGGYAGVWEYTTAVNASGQATAWATLSTISNTTAGLTQSGRITFDPPTNWKAASLAGGTGEQLYYVRFRATSAGTAPVVNTILGRNYVNATADANGIQTGTVPVFDKVADANNDGYLTDAEFANHAAGKDARFVSESRVVYPGYGQMRFVVNPASAATRAWAADYHIRFLDGLPLADGLFVDNATGKNPIVGQATLESQTNYSADAASLLRSVRDAVAPRWLLANTAGGGFLNANVNAVVSATQSTFEEFFIRPLAATSVAFTDLAAAVSYRLAADGGTHTMVLDSHPQGAASAIDPRYQISTLAYYYLIADPQRTYLMVNGGYEPNTSWTRHWIPAAATDVGQPLGTWSEWWSGADPANTALNSKIYKREYSNAVVLYKTVSYTKNVGTGTTADNTATTHVLNGNFRELFADGTLGPVVSSVTLRNGEGKVMIRA